MIQHNWQYGIPISSSIDKLTTQKLLMLSVYTRLFLLMYDPKIAQILEADFRWLSGKECLDDRTKSCLKKSLKYHHVTQKSCCNNITTEQCKDVLQVNNISFYLDVVSSFFPILKAITINDITAAKTDWKEFIKEAKRILYSSCHTFYTVAYKLTPLFPVPLKVLKCF